MDSEFTYISNKPRLKIIRSMSCKNSLRHYKASPEDIILQMRLENQLVSLSLSFDETVNLINNLNDILRKFPVKTT